MRSPINIVGGFYKDPNKHWSAQDTLNWIPVKSERSGTRTEWQFRDAPGVKPLVKLGVNAGGDFIEAGPGRGLRNVEGKLFAVAGNTLFQITNDLISIPYGTIPGVNRVSMAHNQYGSANQLLTVNGSAGYVFNTSTLVFEKITDTGYPGAFVADYVDGYLAQVESLGRYWFHSDLAEAREYSTLDQYEAEGDPDRIVTLHVAYREVLLFGVDTIEPYVNAPRGSGFAPFQRAANTVIQCGCSAKFSPRNIAGVVPFLDDKRVVQYLQGYSVNRISTVGIEQALGECSREEIANAYAYTYEDRGHKIYYLTVPGRFTFGYDFLTQEWHRRATSGLPDLAFTDVAFWNGMWVALDRRYGRLYELDWGYKLDSCEPLVRERVTGVLSNNQNRVTVNELELLFNVGTEESVCQPFEEQPEGPSITGSAPDGTVGQPYGPFSYTISGGTPPYVVTSRAGSTIDQTNMVMNSAGTITATTPDTLGVFTNIARVTDAKGLFDELTDTITVSLPMILTASLGVNNYVIPGIGETDWSSAPIATDGGVRLYPYGIPGGRYVAHNVGGAVTASYNDDAGVTWTPTVGNIVAASEETIYLDGAVCIPGQAGSNRIYRSTDNGVTYTGVSGTTAMLLDTMEPGGLEAAGATDTLIIRTDDAGATWTDDVAHGMSLASGGAIGNDGINYYIGGKNTVTNVPILKKWSLANGLTTETLPGTIDQAGPIVAFAFNGTARIAASFGNEIIRNTGSGWVQTAKTFTHPVRQLFWTGINFLAVTSPTGGGAGELWYSQDGLTWTQSTLGAAYAIHRVAQQYE